MKKSTEANGYALQKQSGKTAIAFLPPVSGAPRWE